MSIALYFFIGVRNLRNPTNLYAHLLFNSESHIFRGKKHLWKFRITLLDIFTFYKRYVLKDPLIHYQIILNLFEYFDCILLFSIGNVFRFPTLELMCFCLISFKPYSNGERCLIIIFRDLSKILPCIQWTWVFSCWLLIFVYGSVWFIVSVFEVLV